jgi:hypothetical protein
MLFHNRDDFEQQLSLFIEILQLLLYQRKRKQYEVRRWFSLRAVKSRPCTYLHLKKSCKGEQILRMMLRK